MMKKLLTSAVLVGAAVVSLAGCSSVSYAENPDAPATLSPKDEVGGYNEEYVKLKDGSVIHCLVYDKGYQSGSMSCDWGNVQKK